MSKKEAIIRPTRDGRFWSMGIVVQTIDEALERCARKSPNKNIHLEFPSIIIGDLSTQCGVCGPPEYIRMFV